MDIKDLQKLVDKLETERKRVDAQRAALQNLLSDLKTTAGEERPRFDNFSVDEVLNAKRQGKAEKVRQLKDALNMPAGADREYRTALRSYIAAIMPDVEKLESSYNSIREAAETELEKAQEKYNEAQEKARKVYEQGAALVEPVTNGVEDAHAHLFGLVSALKYAGEKLNAYEGA